MVLYFRFLKYLAMFFFIFTLLSIPALYYTTKGLINSKYCLINISKQKSSYQQCERLQGNALFHNFRFSWRRLAILFYSLEFLKMLHNALRLKSTKLWLSHVIKDIWALCLLFNMELFLTTKVRLVNWFPL